MIQDTIKIEQGYSTVQEIQEPVSERANEWAQRSAEAVGMSEASRADQANQWAARANERGDERVTHCEHHDF